MPLKAINLYKLSSSPAPDKWKELEEIKKQRPPTGNYEVSLQQLNGTNIAIWEIRKSVLWEPYGEPVLVLHMKAIIHKPEER